MTCPDGRNTLGARQAREQVRDDITRQNAWLVGKPHQRCEFDYCDGRGFTEHAAVPCDYCADIESGINAAGEPN